MYIEDHKGNSKTTTKKDKKRNHTMFTGKELLILSKVVRELAEQYGGILREGGWEFPNPPTLKTPKY